MIEQQEEALRRFQQTHTNTAANYNVTSSTSTSSASSEYGNGTQRRNRQEQGASEQFMPSPPSNVETSSPKSVRSNRSTSSSTSIPITYASQIHSAQQLLNRPPISNPFQTTTTASTSSSTINTSIPNVAFKETTSYVRTVNDYIRQYDARSNQPSYEPHPSPSTESIASSLPSPAQFTPGPYHLPNTSLPVPSISTSHETSTVSISHSQWMKERSEWQRKLSEMERQLQQVQMQSAASVPPSTISHDIVIEMEKELKSAVDAITHEKQAQERMATEYQTKYDEVRAEMNRLIQSHKEEVCKREEMHEGVCFACACTDLIDSVLRYHVMTGFPFHRNVN